MLSSTCKYALRAVIYLAHNVKDDEKIGIKKISRDLGIPMPFLSKILQTLARHKLLSSTKGPSGGFGIGRGAENIFLIDIVEIIDGLDFFNNCVIGVNYCSEQEIPCALHSRYAHYREKIKLLFKNTTIAELLEDAKKGKQAFKI